MPCAGRGRWGDHPDPHVRGSNQQPATLTVSETTTERVDKPRAKTAAGLRTIPLLLDGRRIGALILVRDVSEVRHHERELRHAARVARGARRRRGGRRRAAGPPRLRRAR